ncbi:MAG: MFS transporter [Bifidobacterium tsurumiense]|uniref:MFS transporter n=2 Tax=Bifidobacterium tsurumiense TaxID=356829 RepID=UPI002A8406C9|nr:MFS transporter [Bifidobacterium tsurumiense]MDY4678398.1 MFS transporter [Bifidobacterium tsurumiense]
MSRMLEASESASHILQQNSHNHNGLWHSKIYIAWFTADTASAAGAAFRAIAISLVGYAISGSTISAGWLGTASMMAQQASSLFGGTFVDRHDRGKLIIVNAFAGVLAWGIAAVLLATHTLTFLMLFTISMLASSINGFLGSATDAILRSIIDIQNYPRARSLNEGRDATISMLGGPAGGFLYGVNPWLPFAVSSILYAVSGVAASHMHAGTLAHTRQDTVSISNPRNSFIHDLLEGWSWSFSRKTIVIILSAASLVNFGVNGIQYTIQLHLVSAGTNATLVGFISGGISLSMLLGSTLAAKFSNGIPSGITACLAFAFICVCAIPMTFTDQYWAILIANSLMGLPFPIINAMLLGFAFAKSPARMQGRIVATLTVPAQLLSTFCSGIAGMLLPILAFKSTLLVFGMLLVVGAAIAITSPSIRRIPRPSQWSQITI